MAFPFMKLPLELRRMVYTQALARDQDVGFGLWYKYWSVEFTGKRRMGGPVNKDRINILLVNKQVYEEASKVLYSERFFKAQINMAGIDISGAPFEEDPYAGYIPPKRISEIRNLEICINTYSLVEFRHTFLERMGPKLLLENVSVFYYKVASHFRDLKNIVIKLPCRCLWDPPIDECITRQDCEEFLRPLLRLRASNSIKFECHHNTANELKEVLDNTTATFRSSNPVGEVSHFQRTCVDLRDKAAPMLRKTKDRVPRAELALAFWEANELLADDEPSVAREQEFWRHVLNVETLLLHWQPEPAFIEIELRD